MPAVRPRAPAWNENQNFLLENVRPTARLSTLETAEEGGCEPALEPAGTLAGVWVKTRLLWIGQTPGIVLIRSRTEVFFTAAVPSRRMLTAFDLHKWDLV